MSTNPVRTCAECPAPMPADSHRSRRTCSEACARAAQRRAHGEPRRRRRGASLPERAAELLAETERDGGHRIARRLTAAGVPAPERYTTVDGRRAVAPAASLVYADAHILNEVPRRRIRPTCGRLDCLTPEHLQEVRP